jgi:hypothetical protein
MMGTCGDCSTLMIAHLLRPSLHHPFGSRKCSQVLTARRTLFLALCRPWAGRARRPIISRTAFWRVAEDAADEGVGVEGTEDLGEVRRVLSRPPKALMAW